MELTISQLCYLRSLVKCGIPSDLLEIVLRRGGTTREEHDALLAAGWVKIEKRTKRVVLTPEGKKGYNRAKVGRYF